MEIEAYVVFEDRELEVNITAEVTGRWYYPVDPQNVEEPEIGIMDIIDTDNITMSFNSDFNSDEQKLITGAILERYADFN
jgi:hypothetical protein